MVQQGSRSRLTDRDQAQSIPAGYVFNRNGSTRSIKRVSPVGKRDVDSGTFREVRPW